MNMHKTNKRAFILILVLTVAVFSIGILRLSIHYAVKYLTRIVDSVDEMADDPILEPDSPVPNFEADAPPSNTDTHTPIRSSKDDTDKEKDNYPSEEITIPDNPFPEEEVQPDKPAVPDPPEVPAKKHAIFGYMPVEDQSYLITISNRFTLTEINTIIDSYTTGGEPWEASKSIIKERVSPEEIQRVRYLIHEYML